MKFYFRRQTNRSEKKLLQDIYIVLLVVSCIFCLSMHFYQSSPQLEIPKKLASLRVC